MKPKKLYCFTYAGGTSDFFNVIEKDLEGIEIVAFEYAGHGKRHKEPFYEDFRELADDMFEEFKRDYNGEEYALFGYSMGSISLVEVLKRIMCNGMPLPENIFLAAHEPHTKAELAGFTPNELDEWVKERTIRFGAVPERLLNNKVFWRTYLPIYRADYGIIRKYKFEELDLKCDLPATVFYSENDTPLEEMKKWDDHFTCEYHEYTGNHFFITEHHGEMGKIIKEKMKV